jgi:hypothetical protein|tara:strand:- start:921 stop:1160 length:240 start_codon:yes stop_codon:yes gene_type:complete
MENHLIQKECEVCSQVITLCSYDTEINLCIDCDEKLESHWRGDDYIHTESLARQECEAEEYMCRFDDDPNVYGGTYSEM